MILLILACGTAAEDLPPPAAPAPTPTPEPVFEGSGRTVGHCTSKEKMRFSCATAKGKVVSLCEAATGWVYRFGEPGKPELSVPSVGYSESFELGHRETGADEEYYTASVWNEGHRYTIESHRTEDQFEGRVGVRKGAVSLATLACVGPISADFTELDGRFQGEAAKAEAWVGRWLGGEAELTISESGGALSVVGEATWHGRNPGQVHTGELEGPLVRRGDAYSFDKDGCELTLTRTGPDAIEGESNTGCGGLNVTFSWGYAREP